MEAPTRRCIRFTWKVAATFNLPFPFTHQITSRSMSTPGLVHIQCNGGHVWMNADMMVAPHPYYAVTEESRPV